ncbi:Uncharacterised protein [uncultured archaeon]|nr:Uncharacterised protein [uncultured archaeon]
MALTVHVFATSRKDSLADLKKHTSIEDVKAWSSKVGNTAQGKATRTEINAELFKAAGDLQVIDSYAVVLYPPGDITGGQNTGKQIKSAINTRKIPFTWGLTPNPALPAGTYEIYLELITSSSGQKTNSDEGLEPLTEDDFNLNVDEGFAVKRL